MAKRKMKVKRQVLTEDELLAQALVPEDEQPYKVPENWVWVRLLSGFNNVTSSFKKIQQKDYLGEGQFAVVDQGKELIGGYTNEEELLYGGKLPIIVFGDHTRIIKYIDFPFAQGADGVKLLHPNTFVNSKFFYYSMQNIDIPDLGYRRHFPLFPHFKFPLPPITEQQRIVECIERLFEKLDRAKELVQIAIDSFETRKLAILHKAFTGELTAKWRKKNGVGMESWEEKKLGDFCFVTKLAGFEYTKNIAPNLSDTGIPLFKGKNIQSGELVLEFESFIPKDISDELPRSKLTKKCLLTPYVGAIGNIAIFNAEFEAHLGSNVGKIELLNNLSTEEFLLYFLQSNFGYTELTRQKKATAQESISIQAIRECNIKIPSFSEQQEIIRILDSLLEKEQQVRELCVVIEKIDMMKKVILARAFRGELGTNKPKDGRALEVLEKILEG